MQAFDHDYVIEVIERLLRLDADATPSWGTMARDQMIGHLIRALQFSMGRGPKLADQSTWFRRWVFGPLILNGIVKIPKNLPLPKPAGESRANRPVTGDLETLHAVLEEYMSLVQAGELNPPRHAFLGDIGVDGWAKMHIRHFEHHLQQFGA